jgi:hypothetical protein
LLSLIADKIITQLTPNTLVSFSGSIIEGISQLKNIILVCDELNIPNVSMICLNKNNMPYRFSFKDYADCDSSERRMAYFAFEFKALVGYTRSFLYKYTIFKTTAAKRDT